MNWRIAHVAIIMSINHPKIPFKHQLRILLQKFVYIFPSKNTLRFLFEIENILYYLEGQLAIDYGQGLHPKHRLTHYHQFFTSRIRAGESVLDIGCGIGALAYDIAQDSQALVVGIDINPQNITTASQRFSHPHIHYLVGDVLQDLPSQSFDVIVLSNVLEHLSERSKFISSVQHKTGAKRMLIRVPLFERDWRVPLKHELGVEWRLDPTHQIEYTLESFQEEMTAAHQVVQHLEVRWGEIWAETYPIEMNNTTQA